MAVFGYGWLEGLRHQQALDGAATRSQALKVIKIQEKQSDLTQKVVTKYIQGKERTRYVYRTIEKQVPVYLGERVDRGCKLTFGWVRLYNSAVMSQLPGTPSSTDATPSQFTAVDALGNATQNYHTCNQIRNQLISLQTWARGTHNTLGK